MSKGQDMFNKNESRVYSSKRGSEVYVHSGLHDPWGALESDGLDDPDDVRDIVEAIEEFNGPDGTGPKDTAEQERLEKKFIGTVLAHIALAEGEDVANAPESTSSDAA